MPTFFSRPYMRGKPKPTEKRVGAFVLALALLIVGVFLLTGGLLNGIVNASPVLKRAKGWFGISEKPLFVAAPENLPPPAPPRELRVAESLLPAAPGSELSSPTGAKAFALRRDADAGAAREAGVDAALVEAVKGLNGRWIYTRAYETGTATIADLGDVVAAAKACDARRPEGSRPLSAGRGGWQADGRAGFWSGRYYTEIEAAAGQGANVEALARSLAGLQLAYGPFPEEPAVTAVAEKSSDPVGGTRTSGAARFAEVPGTSLVAPARIERYAENLYEKINGKESAFRAFFVVDLKFGQYADPEAQQSYDVYVYDMAAPANAMGIYMSERVPSAAAIEVGRDGYVSGTSVFFWKGQYYVNVLGPAEGGEPELNNSKRIAAAIAETIADAGEPFWAETVLPAEGRVPYTFSYQATNALGYEFLQRLYSARYEIDGKKLQIYVTRAVDAAAAKSMFDRFADSTARYDKVVARESLAGGDLFVYETPMPGRPSKFGAAFHKGPYFGGAYDGEDQQLVQSRARALFDTLSADDPGDPEAAAAVKMESDEEQDAGEDASGSYGEGGYSGGEESSEGGESGEY
ncbi:MAG TPA: hypothetical protein PK458_16660 [Phycisphaerae bacterium]|nr:hypothetical protein [Phycisphaerae bacterium]